MSAQILHFPRTAPMRALCVGCEAQVPLPRHGASSISRSSAPRWICYRPTTTSSTGGVGSIKDQDGRAMLDELAGQLDRLGTHMADVADALSLTAVRIRDAMIGMRAPMV